MWLGRTFVRVGLSRRTIYFSECHLSHQQCKMSNLHFARTKCCDITIRIATFAWITIFLIPKEFAIIRYYLWKIGLYLDWSRLVTSHRLFTGLEHRFGIPRACVCMCVYANVRLLSWQIIIYSCYGIFFTRCLNA